MQYRRVPRYDGAQLGGQAKAMLRAENINPAILAWARETAGLSVEEAAKRVGLSNSARSTAIEKLTALESGDELPTRNQLLKFASTYRRPLTTFYMHKPPVVEERGEDFRTFADPVSAQETAVLDALLRDIRARHDMVRSIIEDDDEFDRLSFVGSMSINEVVEAAANRLKVALGIFNDLEIRRRNTTRDELFAELRNRIERIGVFVLLAGNLGTHHSNISERVFRGFAIADNLAPFIVINDQDAKSARSFTLIHELAHIFVGSTGISGTPSTVEPRTPLARVEKFCNDVAGEFLLPRSVLPDTGRLDDAQEVMEVASNLADVWKVSESMVAYRMWQDGRMSSEIYGEVASHYTARWQEFRDKTREQAREDERGGPSYYTVRRHRLGAALISLVGRTLRANEVTHTKAAKLLGVKPSSVEPLLAGVEGLGGTFSRERGRA